MRSATSSARAQCVLSYRNTLLLAVAAAVFLIALDNGGYAPATRSTVGIAVWWALLLLAAAGLGLPRALPRPALAVGILLLAFTAWTLASARWAPSAEDAVAEANRASLYLGVLLLAAVAAPALPTMRTAFAGAVVATAVVALASRLFPEVVDPGELADIVVAAEARLSYPLGYWNGLAIFAALGLPLLLGAAVEASSFGTRFLAVAPIPALLAIPYLASSRGGFLTVAVGAFGFVVLTARRWTALVVLAIGAIGGAGAIAAFAERKALVDAPLSATAEQQAPAAAVALLAACVVAGLAHAALRALPVRRSPPAPAGWALVGLAVVVGAAALGRVDVVERFEDFRRAEPGSPATVEGHLLQVGSTGRWQQWGAALDQFEHAPIRGGGAGSYGGWWLQHGSEGFVTEAHSLYLEVLGELGAVGLALLGSALAVALACGVARCLRAEGRARIAAASVTAAAGAWAVAAAVDWMWELTVVSLVGVACLGLLVGNNGRPSAARSAVGARVVVAVVAAAALALQAPAVFVDEQLRVSEQAAARGDIATAADRACRAAELAPWAAAPRLQLALVSELAGEPRAALRHLDSALARDSANWRLWFVAARLHVKTGDVEAARRALERARTLNPKSAILQLPS